MPENQNNEHYHQHDTGRQQNALGRIPESVDEFSIRTRTKCQEMEIFLGRALELSRQNQRSLAATEWLIENIHERYLKHQMNSPTGYFVHMMRKGFDVPHHVISEHNRDAYRQQREEEERLKIKSERKTAERQNYLEDLYARNEYQFVFREAQKYSAQGAFLSLLLQEPALIPPDPLLQMVQKAGEGMKDCPPFLAPVSWSWFIVQITKALTDYKTSSSSTSGLPSAFIARRSLMTSNHCVTKSIAS